MFLLLTHKLHLNCVFVLLEFVSKRLSIEMTDFQTDIACFC